MADKKSKNGLSPVKKDDKQNTVKMDGKELHALAEERLNTLRDVQVAKVERPSERHIADAVKRLKTIEMFPKLHDALDTVEQLVKTMNSHVTKDRTTKEMNDKVFLAITDGCKMFYEFEDNTCHEMLGDELAKCGGTTVILDYMKILTNTGKNIPLEGFNQTCFKFLLVLCWNYTTKSNALCSQFAKEDLLSLLLIILHTLSEKSFKNNDVKYFYVRAAMNILDVCTKPSENIKYYKKMKAYDIVMWFAQLTKNDPKAEIFLSSVMILTQLFDDRNKSLLLADDAIIKRLLQILEEALKNEDHMHSSNDAVDIAWVLMRLAHHDKDTNAFLVQEGILRSLTKMTSGSVPEQIAAVKTVWALTFASQNIKPIREATLLVERIRNFAKDKPSNIGEKLHKAANSAIWMLEGNFEKEVDEHSQQLEKKSTSRKIQSKGSHIMISYNWACQRIMIKVKDQLEQRGYHVWMDIEKMTGSTLECMAKAVENSVVVLVCLSQKYKDSISCKTEGEYAYSRHKTRIPILVEEGYTADGWLGALVATDLWFDFSSEDAFLRNFSGLVAEIGDRGKLGPGQVPQTPALTPNGISVKNWSSNDVFKWLHENNITKLDGQSLDGEMLLFLKNLKKEAPEFFYRFITQPKESQDFFFLRQFTELINDIY